MTISRIFLLVCLAIPAICFAQMNETAYPPESMAMPRSKMYLEDKQVIIFNGIGSVNPRQFSITGLTNLKFYPVDIPGYEFYFDFLENLTGTVIQDNTPQLWKTWLEESKGTDPLGANLRPEFVKLLVTQDEIWQPNQYYRKGVFHHKVNSGLISFGIESWTSVSGKDDEVYLKLKLNNYNSKELDITLIPVQKIKQINSAEQGKNDPFTVSDGQVKISVATNVSTKNEQGFRIVLPAQTTGDYFFAISPTLDLDKNFPVYQSDIEDRFSKAYQHTIDRLKAFTKNLPVLSTQNNRLNELYKRCILTVAECRWERNNFILNPFWASGTWPISMIWDQCFSAEVLAMADPESLKETIKLSLRECKMQQSWIFWHGAVGNIVYIQDPFALQETIDAYLKYTGDFAILNEVTGEATVYEWMKRWAYELQENYSRADGLIDIGPKGEKLIEMRTYGYNDVVPIVSILAADFYQRMHEWAVELDDKDAPQFLSWAEKTGQAVNKLWNDDLGWFDILYADGTKKVIWSYHLFESLESSYVSASQKQRMIQHIRDGEFLAPYGLYSVSRRDTLHWDRIDGDWGGGGQYAGMPLKIAKSLFKLGYSHKGFEILKRFAKYTDHFPYISQNPWSDKMFQDQSSMPLQISAGAGVEAVISGIFGLLPQPDGSLIVNPSFEREIGDSELTGFIFRDNRYDVILRENYFKVKKNGNFIAENRYGDKLICGAD